MIIWLWKILLGHNWDPYFEELFSQPDMIYAIYHGGTYVDEARITLIVNEVDFPLFTEMFMPAKAQYVIHEILFASTDKFALL